MKTPDLNISVEMTGIIFILFKYSIGGYKGTSAVTKPYIKLHTLVLAFQLIVQTPTKQSATLNIKKRHLIIDDT